MRRRAAALALLLAAIALPLGGCGLNLSVRRCPTEIHTTDGRVVPVEIDRQRPYGPFQLESPVLSLLLAIPLEPIDWLMTASGAIDQVLHPGSRHVVGGPFGYLAALTPFATTVDAFMLADPWPAREVDPELLERLLRGDVEAARKAFADPNLVAVRPR